MNIINDTCQRFMSLYEKYRFTDDQLSSQSDWLSVLRITGAYGRVLERERSTCIT